MSNQYRNVCGPRYLRGKIAECVCRNNGVCPGVDSVLCGPIQGHQWWSNTKPAPCVNCGLLYEDYSLACQRGDRGMTCSYSAGPAARNIDGVIVTGPPS